MEEYINFYNIGKQTAMLDYWTNDGNFNMYSSWKLVKFITCTEENKINRTAFDSGYNLIVMNSIVKEDREFYSLILMEIPKWFFIY